MRAAGVVFAMFSQTTGTITVGYARAHEEKNKIKSSWSIFHEAEKNMKCALQMCSKKKKKDSIKKNVYIEKTREKVKRRYSETW